MRSKRKTQQFRKAIGEFLPELQKVFDNEKYRDSPMYKKVVRVLSDIDRIQEVKLIEADLIFIQSFAKLRGLTTLEQLSREIIRLF